IRQGFIILSRGDQNRFHARRTFSLSRQAFRAVSSQAPSMLLPAESRSAIQLDAHQSWLTRRFSFGTVFTAMSSILIGAVFFALIPRVWIGKAPFSDDKEVERGRALTGFTPEVKLGDFGEILESTDRVMEVRLFLDDQELDVERFAIANGFEEPLFRGRALGRYRAGRWSPGNLRTNQFRMPIRPRTRAYRQAIRLEPIGTEFIFAMHPVTACRVSSEAARGAAEVPSYMNPISSVIRRRMGQGNKNASVYFAYSPVDWNAGDGTRQIWSPSSRQAATGHYNDVPGAGFDRLVRLARQVTQGLASDREKASALEAHLRDSGQYGYSLNASITDPMIDPVEDFLFNRKQGHCEYFASALTLMLRAVGIPSRLISGFKGGVMNSLTGVFEVQQRHAHAWVEAYIDSQWVVLDATPADRSLSVLSLAPVLKSWQEIKLFISDLWSNQIMNVDMRTQTDRFYEPLRRAATDWWKAMQGNRSKARSLWQILKDFLLTPERWFSGPGAVLTLVFGFTAAGLWWLSRLLWRWLRKLSFRTDRRIARPTVEFYERFAQICARNGLQRSPSTTHREFGVEVTSGLQDRLSGSGLDAVPGQLVEFFQIVRFGCRALNAEQLRGIDQQLDALVSCLGQTTDDSGQHAPDAGS
ncbi:MAG: transglutaminaseTgpA domain-containing protein, partial [Planctomycetaceae bacterium]